MQNSLRNKLFPHPAQKWLYVSIAGFLMCFTALGMHVFGSDSQGGAALPKKVMSQVFGFTPYYFVKNTPPGKLRLKLDSAKFLGNALSFELVVSKDKTVNISEKAAPDNFAETKAQGDRSLNTDQGTAMLGSAKDGRVIGTLLTKDKTLITVDAPESLNSDTIEAILRSFTPIDKSSVTKP